MNKKICIITSSYPQKKYQHGTARDFAILLRKKQIDVYVLAMSRGKSKIEDDEIKVEFIPWFGSTDQPLDIYNPKNPIHALKMISLVISGILSTLKFIKKNRIDYCFAMWAVPSGIFALASKILLGIPYSIWSLGSDICKIDKIHLGKFLLKKVLKNSHHLYADGLVLARDVKKISNRDCEFLASNRIFDITEKEINYRNFDDAKINFIFLGRYHYHKGVDILIQSIANLSTEEKEKSLFHIFGMPGPEEEKIREMVKKLKLESIAFINNAVPADDVFSYIRRSSFLIIPSRIESIPVVFSNAIESDKPLIVTDVGDMEELVRKYNVGFVTKPNAKELTKAVQTAINADNDTIEGFREGRKKLKEYLNMERSVNMFLNNIK